MYTPIKTSLTIAYSDDGVGDLDYYGSIAGYKI